MPPKNNFHGSQNLVESDVCVLLNLVEIGIYVLWNLVEMDIISIFALCLNRLCLEI